MSSYAVRDLVRPVVARRTVATVLHQRSDVALTATGRALGDAALQLWQDLVDAGALDKRALLRKIKALRGQLERARSQIAELKRHVRDLESDLATARRQNEGVAEVRRERERLRDRVRYLERRIAGGATG